MYIKSKQFKGMRAALTVTRLALIWCFSCSINSSAVTTIWRTWKNKGNNPVTSSYVINIFSLHSHFLYIPVETHLSPFKHNNGWWGPILTYRPPWRTGGWGKRENDELVMEAGMLEGERIEIKKLGIIHILYENYSALSERSKVIGTSAQI